MGSGNKSTNIFFRKNNFIGSFDSLKNLRVSAHIFIRRNGEIIQFVPFHLRAWHAGRSSHKGRENCNNFSVGIELEGSVDENYEENQYVQLREL